MSQTETIEVATIPTDQLEAEVARRRAARAKADAEVRRAQEERQRLEDAELAAKARRDAEEARLQKEQERIEAQQRADEHARTLVAAADAAVQFIRLTRGLSDASKASVRLFVERSCADVMDGWLAGPFANYLLTRVGGGAASDVDEARQHVRRLDAAEAKKTEGGAQ